MDATVLIPTYQRPAKLAACLTHLARQTLPPDRYEVLVGLDGPDDTSLVAADRAWRLAGGRADSLRILPCPKRGLAATRNALLPLARGRTMVSANDDILAEPQFLAEHAAAHATAARQVIISGDTPWLIHHPDRLFDRLIRETSMVFFYDRMNTPEGLADPNREWGFRHAWGLNFSAPMSAVRELGGFAVFPATYGYEDNEIAFRMQKRWGMPVLYRPTARAWHDHRMSPAEYLQREYKLGYAAWGFAKSAPECAATMFGRDITSDTEAVYSREFVVREEKTARRLRESFESLAAMPSGAIAGLGSHALIRLVYEQQLLLKRWEWRRGLVDAIEGRALNATAPGRLAA